MDTKILLRLIRDDIKILEDINDSFISQTNLTCEEVEVALARSRALVMEFEMLSKNLSREEEPRLFGEAKIEKSEEESEKKVRSLRNFLPFIKLAENTAPPITDHPGSKKEETKEGFPFEELPVIEESSKSKEILSESKEIFSDKEKNGVVIDTTPLRTEVPIIEIVENTDDLASALVSKSSSDAQVEEIPAVEILSVKSDEEKKTLGEILVEKHQNVNDLLSQDRTEVKFESKPLKSIREGIGINDRFLFIRELFHNNSEKYEQTLATLDELTGIEDAVRYLKQNFKWSKSEAGEKFLLLIKRRFTK